MPAVRRAVGLHYGVTRNQSKRVLLDYSGTSVLEADFYPAWLTMPQVPDCPCTIHRKQAFRLSMGGNQLVLLFV